MKKSDKVLMVLPMVYAVGWLVLLVKGKESNYYPFHFFWNLREFSYLALSLILFKMIDIVPAKIMNFFDISMVKGFIYGLYAALGYLSISYLRYPVVFFGFSYGILGFGLFYYLSAMALLFAFLCKRYSPYKAVLASFFTLFIASVVYELPNWTFWTRFDLFSVYFWTEIIKASLLIPALYVLKIKFTRLFRLVPFLLCSFFILQGIGDPRLLSYPRPEFVEVLWMICRFSTFVGLFFTMWFERKEPIKIKRSLEYDSHNLPEDIQGFAHLSGRILDLGCGNGRIMDFFKDFSEKIIGLDVEKYILRNKSDRVCGDAQQIPFVSGSFDGVICSEILEHLASPTLCVEEIRRILKNGGTLFVSAPVLNIPCPFLIPIFRKISGADTAKVGHLHVFSSDEVLTILEKGGIVITDKKYLGFTAILNRLLGVQRKRLDIELSKLQKRMDFLKYFSSQLYVRGSVKK